MKKMHVIGSIVLVFAFVLTACGTAATAAPATVAPATQAPATQAPATVAPATAAPTQTFSDKVMLVTPGGQSLTTFTKNFNPFTPRPLFPTVYGIYEPLMIRTAIKGETNPWLATDYKWSDDKLTLTFTIREGVKWSDGQDFSASDVAYTFNLLKGNSALSGTGQTAVGKSGLVSDVVATDATHVDFKFTKVFIPVFSDIIQQVIVPEHIWKNVADPVKDTNDNPVGTGPFTQVVDFQDQVYEVDRNPNYWQTGKPYFKGLRMPAFSGNDTAANLFINGQSEWSGQFFANLQEAVLSKNPDLACWWPLVTYQVLFITNTTKAPFNDVIVRKAISMAFDRTKLIDVALQGASKATDLTGMNDAYAKWKIKDLTTLGDNWVTYDPEKANKMLDDAGYKIGADGFRTNKDGSAMKVEMMEVNGFTDWLAIAPLMKQELDALHLNVEMNTYDAAVAFDKWFKGNFDMSLSFGNLGTPGLYTWFSYAMSSSTLLPIGTATTFGKNPWRFSDPAVEPLLDMLATNPDDAVQMQAAIELQKLFAQDAPFIPMWSQPTFLCYSNKNFTNWPSADNPYAGGTQSEQLLILTNVKGK
jgi:peptide/nickel transport system substrate-binding protein